MNGRAGGAMRTILMNAAIFLALAAVIVGCGTTPVDDGTGTTPKDVYNVYYDTDGLANNSVNDLAVDYFHSGLWVATQKGISFYAFKDSTWTTYGTESGLPNLKVTSAAINLGTVWAGTMSGPASLDGVAWKELANTGVLPNTYITALTSMPEPDYSIWFGTRGGVVKRSATGEWKNWNITSGLVSNDVTSIARDRDGNIWVGTQYGISVYDGTKWTSYTTILPSTAVRAVFTDSYGAVWVGTSNGAMEFNGQAKTKFGTYDGLPSPSVNDFTEDYNRVLWVATDAGVAWFDGTKWVKLALPAQVEGAPSVSITSDAVTKSLWVGTTNGLVRYRPAAK